MRIHNLCEMRQKLKGGKEMSTGASPAFRRDAREEGEEKEKSRQNGSIPLASSLSILNCHRDCPGAEEDGEREKENGYLWTSPDERGRGSSQWRQQQPR